MDNEIEHGSRHILKVSWLYWLVKKTLGQKKFNLPQSVGTAGLEQSNSSRHIIHSLNSDLLHLGVGAAIASSRFNPLNVL